MKYNHFKDWDYTILIIAKNTDKQLHEETQDHSHWLLGIFPYADIVRVEVVTTANPQTKRENLEAASVFS